MARTIPKSIQQRLDFFRNHVAAWVSDPGVIGLTSGEVAALQAAYETASLALAAAQLARQDAQTATSVQNHAMETLVDMGGVLIAKIKAAAAGNGATYVAAHLAVPAQPTFTSIQPPTPGDFRAEPSAINGVTLAWTSDLKRTSFYRLERRITMNGRTTHEFLAVVRDNTFKDQTLPIGFTSVEYMLTPVHQRRGGAMNEGMGCLTTYMPGRVAMRASSPALSPALAA